MAVVTAINASVVTDLGADASGKHQCGKGSDGEKRRFGFHIRLRILEVDYASCFPHSAPSR